MLVLQQIRLVAVIGATALGAYICYLLALPFLPAIIWALVIAIVLHPVHLSLEELFGSGNAAALLSVIFAAVAVGLPVLFVAQQLVREAASGATYLEGIIQSWDRTGILNEYPALSAVVTWIQDRFDPAGSFGAFAQWLTLTSTSLLRGSFNQIAGFVLTFYLLFYFLRDRHAVLHALGELSPLPECETSQVMKRLVDTIHATLVGTVAVAAVQGTLGGVMFWWLGLPTPVFWGVVMGLLAVVPVLGAFVVWVPAAIYLALEGAWLNAALLAAWGGIIIAGIDNVLYPMLVGNKLKLHTVVAFIGAVGGIIMFGASGVVLGPAVIAVTLSLVEILKRRLTKTAAIPAQRT